MIPGINIGGKASEASNMRVLWAPTELGGLGGAEPPNKNVKALKSI